MYPKSLSRMYVRSSVYFEIEITVDGDTPNITTDTVSMTMKRRMEDSQEDAVLDIEADVTTKGIEGIAIFSISPSEMTMRPGTYYYEIRWLTGEEDYPLRIGRIPVFDRVYSEVSE